MCGICGFIDFSHSSDQHILNNMNATLSHRGPDDNGSELYQSPNANIGLSQTRLSIIDLSPLGHQPMEFENLSMVYNGEVYNYQEIKDELRGLKHDFVSDSDTEVILHAYKEWGDKCVEKFIGMFVFVIYDKFEQTIKIFRDRAGVKPIYYYWNDDLFLFGSELKAIMKHPSFHKKIDLQSVHDYMHFGYVPAPHSIFENTHKVNPGSILSLNLSTKKVKVNCYWNVYDFYKKPKLDINYDEAKSRLKELLKSAFEYRLIADVPVGVFLSGGFDSTAVTAMLQKGRKEKLNTFTIGFNTGNNEAPDAKNIAEFLGTNHKEYYCTTKEAHDIIPKLPFIYDEPFADSSAIPTTLVSALARENVTVALSADAGDEIFAGYNIYQTFNKNLDFVSKFPSVIRKPMAWILDFMVLFIPNHKGLNHKMGTLASVFKQPKNRVLQTLYKSYFSSSFSVMDKLMLKPPIRRNTPFDDDFSDMSQDLSVPMAIDYKMYLQNDILTKVDRATMSVSLEGREPLLDHRIIEFVAQLPLDFKYKNGEKKRILKDIVYEHVPKEFMDRPKTGFTIPIYDWLRNDLKNLLDEYLNEQSILASGVFNWEVVRVLKSDFLKEKLDDELIIWKLLQFQIWYHKWM